MPGGVLVLFIMNIMWVFHCSLDTMHRIKRAYSGSKESAAAPTPPRRTTSGGREGAPAYGMPGKAIVELHQTIMTYCESGIIVHLYHLNSTCRPVLAGIYPGMSCCSGEWFQQLQDTEAAAPAA